MKYLLTLSVLGIVIVGCSAQPSTSDSAKDAHPDNPDIANVAPEGRFTEEAAPSEPDSSLPVMTVNSPPILLTPIQGNTPEPSTENSVSPGNWQIFTSSTLGVTVTYPPDWSVVEEADNITFTSPSGATIQMTADSANTNNKEFKIGNQYCTSRTNERGQIADICVDNAAFIYTAKFSLQKADGSTHWVTLITKTRTVGDIFEAMFNSLQPTN
jgi:hypothetical protein